MIVGLGVDIMNTSRIRTVIERYGESFLARVYTDRERAYAEGKIKGTDQVYTAFWATKEAVMKALGTGARRGVFFRDIEVLHERSGKPFVELAGGARNAAGRLGGDTVHVSMSHLEDIVVATAVFEKT